MDSEEEGDGSGARSAVGMQMPAEAQARRRRKGLPSPLACQCAYRLTNVKFLRAFFCPYFLRSTTRASRERRNSGNEARTTTEHEENVKMRRKLSPRQ